LQYMFSARYTETQKVSLSFCSKIEENILEILIVKILSPLI